jgi:hypothetical protein
VPRATASAVADWRPSGGRREGAVESMGAPLIDALSHFLSENRSPPPPPRMGAKLRRDGVANFKPLQD